MPEDTHTRQYSFFSKDPPPDLSYPMNAPNHRATIELIRQDIRDSENYMIITGYTSLEYLIRQFGDDLSAQEKTEIVLGNEPVIRTHFQSVRPEVRPAVSSASSLPEEIRAFWLEKGISVLLNRPVLNLIEKIKSGEVSFFYRSNLHAKVYKGAGAVMLGSSNFSKPGLETQLEANVRYTKGQAGFEDVTMIADYYHDGAEEWNEEMIQLLEELLRAMTWQETLARAVTLITEGGWIDQYPDAWKNRRSVRLWPTQKKGIAQALYLIERQGSVLVADPTGSGKTRMGAKLLEALLNRLWLQLKQHRSRYQIICPPLVSDGWEKELRHLDWNTSSPVSHGLLSNPNNASSRAAIDAIKEANILLIDEAHNYLNKTSARSRSVIINRADHVVLFTATPINRKSDDLLRLVEILGLDNLDDDAYKTYRELLKAKDQRSPEKMDRLKRYINRFMVRRTKKDLNEAIDQEPESYRDEHNRLCRYPVSTPRMYKTMESEEDIRLANEIDKRVKQLTGVIYLATLKADGYDRSTNERQKAFLKKRLSMAPALTRYNIRNMLRSSRAALVEHLLGTEEAMKQFGIKDFKTGNTGNILDKVRELKKRPPKTNLTIKLPDFLNEPEEWRACCVREEKLLTEIANFAIRISDRRERGKAKKITELIDQEGMILVFDTALITLNLMNQILNEMGYGKKAMVVTGSTGSTKKLLKESFALEAEANKMAALCSDALAEGVNLQRASAVIFLDMPSVIRIAEQRIGRVERMDSPHKKVSVYWPDDSDAFRLKTDRNFFQRHQMVESLIGSNIRLPDEMTERSTRFEEETLSAEQVIEALEKHQEEDRSWEGFEDAFSSMRALVSGEKKLISEEAYNQALDLGEKQKGAWISVIKTGEPFVFAAVENTGISAPYWVLRTGKKKTVQEINEIVTYLRKYLPESEPMPFDKDAEAQLKQMANWLIKHEQETLPNKKKNALNQMKKILPKWLKNANDQSKSWQFKVRDLNNIASGKFGAGTVDYYELANRWLDIAQPILIHWLEEERRSRKNHNIRLQDVNSYLADNPIPEADLNHILDNLPQVKPADERIRAIIIGV